ncbi:unnamed protein product [Cladocopium goreaui]|uniref:Large ribosomal subunit protein uL24c n=1 Tax=Cladocopium goreaui TaxID=2562237 RepID=A0A9P1DF13_9DINO|nr:unnamed protein product [Cladocopium goreaui]
MGPKRASKASAKPSSERTSVPKDSLKPKPSLSSPKASPSEPPLAGAAEQADEPPQKVDPNDLRLLRSLFHTLRLRMETAGAVTVASSINLQALRHGRVKKIEFVRFPQAETKQQSTQFLQAVLRMHIARSEMLSAVASPWLPALQALARRRLALGPTLDAARQRRENAAVEIQRRVRGTTVRHNMDAENLILAVLKAAKWRKAMADFSVQQATQHLQTQRRACVAQREVQAMRDEKKDESLIRSIFQSLMQRQRLSERAASAAAQTLQQGRRSQISRRELANRQQEHKDTQLLDAVLRTVYWRVKTAHSVAVHSAVKLQTLQRGRVATIEMTRMREAAECFSVLAPALRCLVLRIRLASLEELQAARKLQTALKVAVAKRRNHNACVERLQRYLVGLEKKMKAQRLLGKLHAQRRARTLPRSLMRVALKAAHLRKKLAEHREHHAATTIQARARGGFHRNKCNEVQNDRALRTIICACRRFAVQHRLVAMQQQKQMDDALELWQSVLETFKERAQFAPDLLYNRASLKIASMWRGVKGRREMRRIRLERSAQKASDCFRGFLQCYKAREMLMTRGAECHRSGNRMLLCGALKTLKLRMLFSQKVEEERKKAAMEVLSRYVRGIYLRTGRVFDWEAYSRRTGRRVTDEMRVKMLADQAEVDLVQRVRRHTRQIRLEIEDERRQICHMAALQLQRSWRARQARLQQLLPRLAARLAAERRMLVEMQRQEGQQCSTFSSGCLRPIHAQLMTARPQPPHGWLTCMAEVQESIADVAAADSFALVLGQSGAVYCLPSHGGCDFIGSPEVLELAGPFVLQHQRFLAQTPKVLQISCGLHHAVLLADGGLAFAWGLNDSGQCGVGWPRPKALEQQVVAQATCLQPWAAHYSATTEEMRLAGLLEPQRGDSLASACTSGAVLPRLTSLCAGPRITLALDAEAQLWAWGSSSGVGLPCYMPQTAPRAPPSRGTLRATAGGRKVLTACPFLFFQLIKNSKSDTAAAKAELSTDGVAAGKPRPRMDDQLLSDLDLQEVAGNVLVPTLVCNVTLLEGNALSSAQTDTVLLHKGAQPQAILSPAWGAGGARSESGFASIACGHANFAVTNRGVVHSWAGSQDLLLARSGGGLPAPVPTFARLAACVTSISVGSDHAVALTAHGRVFTWGQLEACTSTERFQRRNIAQPLCVEGPLRGLKISKVAAGRISSVAAIQDAETLLGWDMVELLTVQGKGQLDPAIYEFTAAHGESNQGVSPMSPKMSPKTSPTNRLKLAEKACTPTTRSPTSPSKSPCASPTKSAVLNKVQRTKQEAGRRLCICHSKTLQLVLDDPTTCRQNVPFSRPELFAWAAQQAATAHIRKEEEEEMIKRRSLEEMAAERVVIKRMGNFALVKVLWSFVEFRSAVPCFSRKKKC